MHSPPTPPIRRNTHAPGPGRQPWAPPTPVPLRLVLPRAALDERLAAWLAPAGPGTPHATAHTSHAPLTLQPDGDRVLALAGPLQPGPPLRLPATARRPPAQPADPLQRPWPTGLLLLHLAPLHEPPPDEASASASGATAADPPAGLPSAAGPGWDHWLARTAPEHRLASPTLQADLLVCWLRADGQVRLVFCPGYGWGRLHPPAAAPAGWAQPSAQASRWLPVPELWLPGPEQLRLVVDATTGTATERLAADTDTQAPDTEAPDATPGRHTAQATALGPAVLRRWQGCCFGLVGAGRAGSVLAHSLLRSGAGVRVVDPDTMSPHSLDGDLPAGFDGQPKVAALAHQLRGLARPGTVLDARCLPVACAAAGWLLAGADILVAAADNDAAALWANAWALALLKPLLVVGTGMHPQGAEADLRLLPPGTGCLACVGGFSQRATLTAQLAQRGTPAAQLAPPAQGGAPPAAAAADADAEAAADAAAEQRNGSLRSWGLLATHTGMRMLEQLVAGQLRGALFRRLIETADGGLQVQDWVPPDAARRACPLCSRLLGAGLTAVTPQVLMAVVQALPGQADGSPRLQPAR